MPASVVFEKIAKSLKQNLMVALLLALMTLALYWPLQTFDFVYDDHLYVTDNRQVQNGLTLDGLKWSFTTFHAGNWHPLAWLSHMADFERYGTHAGGQHWTSVLIHAASAILLFLVLSSMTRAIWPSVLVASLFAVHPLHVESVAWISERKDVLCGFFWILTMGAYAHYANAPTLKRYLLVVCSFTLGLLSKAMIVTLPFVLLLLDYWPLQRFANTKSIFVWRVPFRGTCNCSGIIQLFVEKTPLILMASVVCVTTISAQQSMHAVLTLEQIPFDVRVGNAIVAYTNYIGKTFWPANLAILYPHGGMPALWKLSVSLLILLVTSIIAVRKAREYPFLIVGWLWYLGTLIPVIGLVQVGPQSMADRYTYMPLIGVFIALVWTAENLIAKRCILRKGGLVLSLAMLTAFWFVSSAQIETWKNSLTLFEHALLVTRDNPIAQYNIGAHHLENEDCKRAIPRFVAAIEMQKDFAYGYYGLGVCAARDRHEAVAISYFSKAVQIDPNFIRPRMERGLLFVQQGNADNASEDFRHVLRVNPSHEEAHAQMGMLLLKQGRVMDAERHLYEVLQVNPRNADAHNNMGIVRCLQNRLKESVSCFEKAVALAPGNAAIKRNLEVTRNMLKTE